MVTEDEVAERVVCGPDPERDPRPDPGVRRRRATPTSTFIRWAPDQEGFLRFSASEILPRYAEVGAAMR